MAVRRVSRLLLVHAAAVVVDVVVIVAVDAAILALSQCLPWLWLWLCVECCH